MRNDRNGLHFEDGLIFMTTDLIDNKSTMYGTLAFGLNSPHGRQIASINHHPPPATIKPLLILAHIEVEDPLSLVANGHLG